MSKSPFSAAAWPRPLRRIAALVLGAIVLSALTGCEIPGLVASVIAGPEKIPALYELADRPTVVFVDDPADRLADRNMASLLAGRIGEDLAKQKVVSQVIPPVMVERLRADNPDFAKWPIDRIGQQVGAQQVIWVLVQDCRVVEDEAIYHPTLVVRVKVIDADSGTRLFPGAASALAADGQPLSHTTTYRDMAGATDATKAVLLRNLMESAAVPVAQLFYKHQPPEPGSRLP